MLTARTVAPAVLALAALLPAAPAADIDPYVPANSEWMLRVNVRQLADAPALKKNAGPALRAGLGARPELMKPLVALGVDPLTDVTSLTAAGSGLPEDKQAVLIVRGDFGSDKVRATADKQVKEQPTIWKAMKGGGATTYEMRDKGGKVLAYLAVVGEGTVLVATDRKYVTAAAARDPKKPVQVSEALRKLVEKADGKDDVWLASVKPQHVHKLLTKSPYTAGIADDVTAFTARVKAGDDLKVSFSVHTKGKKTAEEVAGLLDAAKGFASIAAQNIDGVGMLLSDLIDACKTSTDGGTATLAGELNEEQIAKATKKK
jgi:hypothetical protein